MTNIKSSSERTVIVGAGVTGLTAAYILQKAGEQCVLLEADERVGGLCKTYILDDIVFDLGPHLFFFNPDFEADQFIFDLLKDEKLINNRFRFAIHAQGRYWRMPFDVFDFLFFYPWRYKREMLQCLLSRGKRVNLDDKSLQAMIAERSGHAYCADVFAPVMAKKALVPCNKLHRDWALRVERDVRNRRVASSGLDRVLSLRNRILTILNPRYYYPSRGFEIIAQKLWNRYRQLGGETILKCGHVSFVKEKGRISEVIVKEMSFPVKNVIWTASINALNSLLSADVSPIHYGDLLIVLLTYNQQKRVHRPFAYTYHPDDDLIFNRIYYPNNIFKDTAPPDREGICVEACISPEVQKTSDKDIVARVTDDIEKLGLYKKVNLRKYQCFRLKDSMPIYELDYEDRIEQAFGMVRSYENLYSVGRTGGYFFCLTPAAVGQGMKIAGHLLGTAGKNGH